MRDFYWYKNIYINYSEEIIMKVLMNTLPTSFQVIGGGGIVALKTKEYLEKEGVNVKLFNYWIIHTLNYLVIKHNE